MNSKDIIDFWFNELSPQMWWVKSDELDDEIKKRFEATLVAASAGELFEWRKTSEGRLAEIIVLDQFSRNMYRNQPKAFTQDPLALVLAQEAISVGADKDLVEQKRAFLYMPFMHSESLVIHKKALKLFESPGMEHNLDYEKQHMAIIEKFGRYPHRNQILGRESTPEEIEFLKQPGSSF